MSKLAFALALAIGLPALAPARPPNIVFLLADDAGVGDFGPYGQKVVQTPHADRLAAEGLTFTNAYCGSAVCAPTRCVLMTGKHTGHGRRRANQSKDGLIPLAADDVTVAEVLKKAGYACGGFGKWGLGNPGTTGVPEKHGFDVWYGYYDQTHAHSYYPDHLIRNSRKVPLPGNADGGRGQYSHDLILAESLQFIEANKARPFFLYAAWTLPHGKFEPPSDAPYTGRPWPQPVKNHAAMLTRFDAGVGAVLAKLAALGLDDDTLVILSSDNGPTGPGAATFDGAAGLRGMKRSLYEGGIRTPFVARWPGKVRPGTKTDALVGHVDFLPTAAELAGVAPPAGVDGVSLAPLSAGTARLSPRHLYWEIYEGPAPFQQAVRLDRWKGYRRGTQEPVELYDLAADPKETADVAAEHPDMAKRITEIMAAEHTPSPHWAAPARYAPKQPKKKGE